MWNCPASPRTGPGNQISAGERERLLFLLKSLRFNIKSPLPLTSAIVTAGGVSLKEIDPRTMASRLVPGLFFCGEVMDLDADTGGYNLQAAFSTGYVAGEEAAAFVQSSCGKVLTFVQSTAHKSPVRYGGKFFLHLSNV